MTESLESSRSVLDLYSSGEAREKAIKGIARVAGAKPPADAPNTTLKDRVAAAGEREEAERKNAGRLELARLRRIWAAEDAKWTEEWERYLDEKEIEETAAEVEKLLGGPLPLRVEKPPKGRKRYKSK